MAEDFARVLTYAEAIAEALCEEMERDERVVVLRSAWGEATAEDVGAARDLADRVEAGRVLELSVPAPAVTQAAVGAAMAGLRPVVDGWPAGTGGPAIAAVVSEAAAMHFRSGGAVAVPIVFRARIGDGALLSEGWLSAIPGLKVVLPSTPADAYGLLKSAIRDENPVLFLEDPQLYPTRGELFAEETVPIGRADVKRAGSDASVVAYSGMVAPALAAAEILTQEGIDVEVLDLRSSLPLDEAAILESVARTGRVVIAQGAPALCSIASEVAALVAEKGLYDLDAPIRRVTGRWAPLPAGPELARRWLPQPEQIASAVRDLMSAS